MPFMRHLPKIGLHAPSYAQYTVTSYPGTPEQSVIADDQAVTNMKAIASEFGARAVVWRYDPVVFTDHTSARVASRRLYPTRRQARGFGR